MQILRFRLLTPPNFRLCTARFGDDCLSTIYFRRTVRVSQILTFLTAR